MCGGVSFKQLLRGYEKALIDTKNIVNLCLHVCCLCHHAGSVNVGAEGGHLLVILLQIVHRPLSSLTVIQIPYVDINIFTGSLLSK